MADSGPTSVGRERIPLNQPVITGKELEYLADVLERRHLSGDGPYTQKCHTWLENRCGCAKALLTHSCTAALEMAALLLDVGPGDEIIMPSYTFVSTANAFVLRGAKPVFVDIRADTLNLDETLIEAAITRKTRAIVPVHYAGVGCEMDTILQIAEKHGLAVVEDAAQGVGSTYRGLPLGSLGTMGAFSFHETKNVISGEGGALLVNRDKELSIRAEIIREKGTNRSRFFRGEVDKYTWQEPGSSYLPSELIAAFLWAQLEQADDVNSRRMAIWLKYHAELAPLEASGALRRPIIPYECDHNAHMYYILLPSAEIRENVLMSFRENQIQGAFHYVPLHSSPAGQRLGRTAGSMKNTDEYWQRLVRLPLSPDLTSDHQMRVIETIRACLHNRR